MESAHQLNKAIKYIVFSRIWVVLFPNAVFCIDFSKNLSDKQKILIEKKTSFHFIERSFIWQTKIWNKTPSFHFVERPIM